MTDKTEKTEAVDETVEDAEQETVETKTLTQAEVNKLIARERKSWSTKYDALKAERDALQLKMDEAEQAAEEKAKTKAEALRKGQPDSVLKLLDKLSYQEQLEWLSDPENQVAKKQIPTLPTERSNQKSLPKIDRII